jgi:streptomycin 6-kinase
MAMYHKSRKAPRTDLVPLPLWFGDSLQFQQFANDIGTGREIAEAWKHAAIAKGFAEIPREN